MKKTVLFTGSFDPFHMAHVWQLQRAYDACAFDSVIVAILKTNPKKPFLQPIKRRLMVAELTLSGVELPFDYQILSIRSNSASALERVRDANVEGEALRVMGTDSFIELFDDKVKRDVLKLFKNIVVERPALRIAVVRKILEDQSEEIRAVYQPVLVSIEQDVDVSSRGFQTDIKGAFQKGLLTQKAYNYIRKEGMYLGDKSEI